MNEVGFASSWEHAAKDNDSYLLFLRVALKAVERGQDVSHIQEPLFTHSDGGQSFEHLKAAHACMLEGETETVNNYFISTGLVKDIRLADALDITLEELQIRFSAASTSPPVQS